MPLDLDSLSQANSGSSAPASAQPANTPEPFVITEDIASGAITITLEDTDMPFGRPREVTAFQSGGKVDIAQGGIYNPGSERPVLQMMAVRENRLVVKGHFRDRIRAGAQRQPGGAEPNHARYMRDLVERVRRRRNPLKISWAGDERSGVLEETQFDEEGVHDIAYTLTFFIAIPPTGLQSENEKLLSPTPSIEDLRSQMAANLAEQRAEMTVLAVEAAATAVISNALGFVSNAIDTLGIATVTAERIVLSTPQQIAAAINNINSSAQNVQTQIDQTRNDFSFDSTTAEDAMANQKVDDYMKWWVWHTTTSCQLDQIVDAMRQIRLQSLEQLRKATKLYRVQDGDTLESIALTQLGSKARASDLGIRPDQLIVGSYVRIPQAT